MKPIAIFALWAFLGWDLGGWVETFAGIPALVALAAGVAIGMALATEARRRIATKATGRPQTVMPATHFEAPSQLDRAA